MGLFNNESFVSYGTVFAIFIIFSSKSNKLWIRFYSDSAITGQGFIANYTQSKDFSKAASTTVAMTTMPGNLGILLF